METKAVITSGEAPESDDDSIILKSLFQASNTCGTLIQGEARESDEEKNNINTKYPIDPFNCSNAEVKSLRQEKKSIKYNSLLHKKLQNCNRSLDKNINELLIFTISKVMEELSDINKQLLKSELVLQESASELLILSNHCRETYNTLNKIFEEDYFSSIKP